MKITQSMTSNFKMQNILASAAQRFKTAEETLFLKTLFSAPKKTNMQINNRYSKINQPKHGINELLVICREHINHLSQKYKSFQHGYIFRKQRSA
jgi:hypothetical protein